MSKNTKLPVGSRQYDLFSMVMANDSNRELYSNLLLTWDSVPKFFVSRQRQARMRSDNGTLPILRRDFILPDGTEGKVEITPAKVVVKGEEIEFYPSDTEELIEDVLRKIYIDQRFGSFNEDTREAYCRFTLQMLRRELAKYNKVRSISEIKLSLEIMKKSHVVITLGNKVIPESSILPVAVTIKREEYREDSKALAVVKFSDMANRDIASLRYRQFNYDKMIALKNQLSRWIFKQLSYAFLNAGLDAAPHKMKFSTIDRNSCLLAYKDVRKRISEVEKAFNELKDAGLILMAERTDEYEGQKLVDAEFAVVASGLFIKDMKAFNRREQELLPHRHRR